MSSSHLDKVNFDLIRYANCWEDADVLLAGLKPEKNARIMSIASAGDNCFSLLSTEPEYVVAVDISKVQLYLTELKKVAIQHFSCDEYKAFVGFTASKEREKMYLQLRTDLSANCMTYWTENLESIKEGIIHKGKFENYFQLFKKEALPKVHSQELVDELFKNKTDEEQKEFYNSQWNTKEWKDMYQQFFGIEMMGEHGRDPEFLKHVKGSVPDLILGRESQHLSTRAAQKNYFLHYILKNRFNDENLPHYVREENYTVIQNNIHRLKLHHGLMDSALEKYPNCTHFNLSDIFEYMDDVIFKKFTKNILQQSHPKAKFAYWNLMIIRKMSDVSPKLNHLKNLSEDLHSKDYGYFYGAFVVESKN